jgi:hypothetical protein
MYILCIGSSFVFIWCLMNQWHQKWGRNVNSFTIL